MEIQTSSVIVYSSSQVILRIVSDMARSMEFQSVVSVEQVDQITSNCNLIIAELNDDLYDKLHKVYKDKPDMAFVILLHQTQQGVVEEATIKLKFELKGNTRVNTMVFPFSRWDLQAKVECL